MEFKYAVLFALLLCTSFSIAASPVATAIRTDRLGAAMQDAICKTDFNTGYMQAIITLDPNASSVLSPSISTLQNDVTTLQGYTDSNDTASFSTYLLGTYVPDMRSADQLAVSVRSNLSSDLRSQLRSNYTELLQTYQTCHFQASQTYVSAKAGDYSAALSALQANLNNLSARGIDVSNLQAIIANAQSEIVVPLQNAASSATNGSQLQSAVQGYCLYDGCANGMNYHLSARFAIARLNASLNFFQSNASSDNLTTAVSQAQSDINSAQSSLDSLNGGAYDSQTESQIIQDLQGASSSIRQAMMGMRGQRGGGYGGMGGRRGRYGQNPQNGNYSQNGSGSQ